MPLQAAVPEFAALETTLDAHRLRVDAALKEFHRPGRAAEASAAVEYALFAPAKRLRPVLALLTAEILQGDTLALLPAACAIEMVHTASLILDDLPSMDDAAQRRGRPATHVAHGEANAILAAFALQNRGFEVLAAGWPGAPSPTVRLMMARELAAAIGLDGMIAGQSVDLSMTGRGVDFETLEFIHSRKTGALFIASATVGALAAGAAERERAAIAAYAKNLGLAFQVVDDLIDVTHTAGEAGKDVNQDARKTTFVSFAGVAGARQLALELAQTSQQALQIFGPRAQPLRDLARYVVTRGR